MLVRSILCNSSLMISTPSSAQKSSLLEHLQITNTCIRMVIFVYLLLVKIGLPLLKRHRSA
jgi:hypothetical protein